MPELFNPAVMPGDKMTPELIEAAAGDFRTVGSKVGTRGGTMVTHWQGLSAVYDAPEETTLTSAMDPVKVRAEAFDADLGSAATALDTFADQVRTIKAEVARIRADAASFLGGITDGKISKVYYGGGDYYTGDFDWHTDEDTVEANNALVRRTHDQQEALWAAERACASAIRAAVGLGPVLAADAANPNGYGVTDIPDNAPMPWGSTVERTEGCLEKAGDGVVDAGASALLGLGNMVGISYTDEDGFGWSLSTGIDTWGGVLQFGVGVATFTVPGLIAGQTLPGPVGRYIRDAQLMVPATAAGLAGIDLYAEDPLHKWKDDPAHTFGGVLFNVATLPLAVTKVSKAGALGRAGRATPDAPDLTPSRLPDGTGSLGGVDVTDVTGLGRRADLDESLSIRTDLDIDLGDGGRADADGPPSDRTDEAPPVDTDRGDTDRGDTDRGDAGQPDGSAADDRPEVGTGSGTEADPRVYGYENRAEALRGAPEPDLEDAADLGRSRDYTPGTPEHMEARWQEYLSDKGDRGETPKSWDQWRDQYITNQGNDPKGKAFEQAYRADHPQYDAGGYQFNTLVPDSTGVRRNYDILSLDPPQAIELKSGTNVDPTQLAKDARLVRDGWSVRYVFGQEPPAATLRRLEGLGIDVEIFHSVPVVVP